MKTSFSPYILLSESPSFPARFDRLAVPTSSGTSILELDNIIRMESDNNYTCVFVVNHKKPLLVAKTLKHFERILQNCSFIRVHQSHLVNARKIVQYTIQKHASVKLSNNEEISVSRSKRSTLKNYLLNHNYHINAGKPA